jgi:glutamate 5-kinase
MMKAEALILLSNIDGIYTGNPSDPESEVIRSVAPGESLDKYILPSKSSAGRGGMESKYNTACQTAEAGIKVIIANGNRPDILRLLLENPEETVHTEFLPK